VTALYRHYDESNALLYVGISVNPMARTSAHADASHWFESVRRVEIEQYPTLSDALNAEAVAIVIEKPAHNKAIPIHRAKRVVSFIEDWPKLRARRIKSPTDGITSASDIINAAGRDRLKVKFGVKDRVLQIYAATNMLPAAWFDALENMTGQQLPRHLFTFKGAAE